MKTTKQANIGIVSVKEDSFTILPLDHGVYEQLKPESLQLQNIIETVITKHDELVRVVCGVRYIVGDSNLCEMISLVCFRIKPFAEVITINEGEKRLSFSQDILSTILNVSYGFLRGTLYERVKDTVLVEYPLPLIPVQELLQMNRFKVAE